MTQFQEKLRNFLNKTVFNDIKKKDLTINRIIKRIIGN